MNRNELILMAAVCQKYGSRKNGGYEISIPHGFFDIPQGGSVQQLPFDSNNPNPNLKFRYTPPGKIVDGGQAKITPIEEVSESVSELPSPQFPT